MLQCNLGLYNALDKTLGKRFQRWIRFPFTITLMPLSQEQ